MFLFTIQKNKCYSLLFMQNFSLLFMQNFCVYSSEWRCLQRKKEDQIQFWMQSQGLPESILWIIFPWYQPVAYHMQLTCFLCLHEWRIQHCQSRTCVKGPVSTRTVVYHVRNHNRPQRSHVMSWQTVVLLRWELGRHLDRPAVTTARNKRSTWGDWEEHCLT